MSVIMLPGEEYWHCNLFAEFCLLVLPLFSEDRFTWADSTLINAMVDPSNLHEPACRENQLKMKQRLGGLADLDPIMYGNHYRMAFYQKDMTGTEQGRHTAYACRANALKSRLRSRYSRMRQRHGAKCWYLFLKINNSYHAGGDQSAC